ncbi:3-oxoacyl-[acyl-carrier-protein] reductase FabG-like [Oppia nitens]|uniref:3-oxoacyl-[acyl-carrier-protein] reductase FabG-like n=1 Tax=Oppia nitens TaxID=1686743 RepID=UPI0023DBF6E7|nr:3-oxoacyl-[acyl-carrier-protein] reductase FabG-like [Oppia nitens]
MNDPRNFKGKVVLTTGSSSGIGAGIAKLFAQLGAHVVITGRKETEILKVANECQQLSPEKLKPLQVVGDVSKSEDLQRLLDETIKTFGQLDVLVNNAGIALSAGVTDKEFMPVFDKIMSVNLHPFVELSHLSVPYLNKTNGTIINISSNLSQVPMKTQLAYEVSKVGIDMMTRVLALELGPTIRVNTVNPGITETNLVEKTEHMEQMLKVAIDRTPMKRIAQPRDVAESVVYLASSAATFVTGANLVIDGGIMYNLGGMR